MVKLYQIRLGPKASFCICLQVLFVFLTAFSLFAQDLSFGGHAKYQLSYSHFSDDDLNSILGPNNPISHELDLRLNTNFRQGPFDFISNLEMLGLGGEGLAAQRQVRSLYLREELPDFADDQRRLFDLSTELSDDKEFVSALRFDRLSLGYTGEKLVFRLGRHTVSWGNALVFQVLDPFNPFSPTEVDKDYKTGEDLLYSQWLFDDGSDLQGLIIPRRDPLSSNIKDDQSSFALKYHRRVDVLNADFDFLLAEHYSEQVYGAGFSSDYLGSVWRLDLSLTVDQDQDSIFSLIANVDRSWVLAGFNVYGFLEFFHSGFGSSSKEYLEIEQDLSERITRGELFTLAKNYLALGFQIEASPLFNLYPSNIFNLDDQSGIFQLRLVYDFLQDLSLTLGFNLPYGPRGTEFGGISLHDGTYLAASRDIYIRTSYYF